jgi:hypothetical protein
LYPAIFPSFSWVLSAGDLFPLNEQVTVRLTVQNPISAEASMRLNLQTLDAPGENASLGTFSSEPETHVHPEWQLVLDNGVVGEYSISFKLTTTAAGYTESPVYTLTLTNVEPEATPTSTVTPTAGENPTATTTPSATAVPPTATATEPQTDTPTSTPSLTFTPSPTATDTPSDEPCPGDCNGDGEVSVDELVLAVEMAMTNPGSCPAADVNDDGRVTIDEVVLAVSSAVNGCADG